MTHFDHCFNDITMQIANAPAIIDLMKLKDLECPLILYGCGEQAFLLLQLCKQYGISVSGVADSTGRGVFRDTKYTILSPSELISNYPDAVILITSWKFDDEIFKKLIHLGYMEEKMRRFPFSHPYIMMENTFKEK